MSGGDYHPKKLAELRRRDKSIQCETLALRSSCTGLAARGTSRPSQPTATSPARPAARGLPRWAVLCADAVPTAAQTPQISIYSLYSFLTCSAAFDGKDETYSWFWCLVLGGIRGLCEAGERYLGHINISTSHAGLNPHPLSWPVSYTHLTLPTKRIV